MTQASRLFMLRTQFLETLGLELVRLCTLPTDTVMTQRLKQLRKGAVSLSLMAQKSTVLPMALLILLTSSERNMLLVREPSEATTESGVTHGLELEKLSLFLIESVMLTRLLLLKNMSPSLSHDEVFCSKILNI